jgi:hypothetical protein
MTENCAEILVAGDLVLDHHIYEGRRHHFGDGVSQGVRVVPQVGGAAIVHDLLVELLAPADSSTQPLWKSRLSVEVSQGATESLRIDESRRAYAFWRPFPPAAAVEKQFWRVSEAMGFGAAGGKSDCQVWPRAIDYPRNPRVIVLSDGGMGFRNDRQCWGDFNFSEANWIVLKTASPLAEGPLWDELTSNHAGRLITLISAHELRKSSARLNAGLSWDETVESVLRELRPGGALERLTRCRHLVVTFESEGALWVDLFQAQGSASPQTEGARVHFTYDAGSIEGEHAHETEGTAFGFLSCLTAAVVWQISVNETAPDFEAAMEAGLSAMRDLRDRGHGPITEEVQGFPAKRLSSVMKAPTCRYSRASFDLNAVASSETTTTWSIVRESQRGDGPLFELARHVVRHGPIAIGSLPHLRIGKLLTIDRREIESLRTLIQIIRRYQKQRSGKKPLSLGVFGPPGAGKSFAVKEIAARLPGAKSWLEFNLSQFASPADLIGAFHQVRDHVLQGSFPVAFFDEFDARQYHWLQYLLAPMQDGRFQEGQITHPIGDCLFVFAGGTSSTFESFGDPLGNVPDRARFEETFRLAKGPDFKSRLDAYLNVVGPNCRRLALASVASSTGSKSAESKSPAGDDIDDSDDLYFPIRRALMIRSELRCPPEAKLDIDEGVLRALLEAPRFKHGSRSLSKLLQPFQSAGSGPLVRSLLPPAIQIAMHADADKFIELCGKVPPGAEYVGAIKGDEPLSISAPVNETHIPALAKAIDNVYQALRERDGSLKRRETFEELPEFRKDSNRASARRMIHNLGIVGLELVAIDPGDAGSAQTDDRKADEPVRRYIEHYLELLAEAEHDGWMQWHFARGWRYDKQRNDEKQQHNCLVPYVRLEDVDRNKDRNTVRHYPAFARAVGMRVAFRT